MARKPPDSEEIEKILKDLHGKTLVVEGIRDEKALKTLGLNNIIKINRKPLHEVAEEIASAAKETVMLTDFDRRGRQLASRLTRLLEPCRIRINRRLRRKVMEIGQLEIEDLKNLKEDSYVKVSTSFNKIHDKSEDKGKGRSGKT